MGDDSRGARRAADSEGEQRNEGEGGADRADQGRPGQALEESMAMPAMADPAAMPVL
ncbi:hypothetical protein ACFUKV_03825 [Streptomyces paradoxus]|uniref:hypothetical protein n=1 Tax=Streptomyces paradoxus TaxID=66375 RepID=UPI0036315609